MAHSHDHRNHSEKNLRIAFFLNLVFALLELVGGFLTNSIAIISDAVHDFGDSFSLGISWYLQKKSKKGANRNYTFGYKRFSVLGALINSFVLVIGSIFVIREAIERLINPEDASAEGMIAFACLGIIVNGYAAYKLHGGKSLNEKVVSLHLIEDVLGWVAILIGALVLLFIDIPRLDPILSILITAYILFNIGKRLKQTLHIFLQGVPAEVDLDTIKKKILTIENISSMHHTHIWTLDGERHVFTAHIKLTHIENLEELLRAKDLVKEVVLKYNFEHCTIETELDHETCALLDAEIERSTKKEN